MIDPAIEVPWAHVRLIDDHRFPGKKCRRCGAKALLEFCADYKVTGYAYPDGADDDTVPEPLTEAVDVALFSCQEHAGELAFASAYTVAAGPTGAV